MTNFNNMLRFNKMHFRSIGLMIVFFCSFHSVLLQAQTCNQPGDIVLYDEAIDGDITGNAGSPSTTIALSYALNATYVVNGSAPDGDRDAIIITVPAGTELTSLTIGTHDGCDAFDRVLLWVGPDNNGTQLYTSAGAGYDNEELGPLAAGTYTLLLNQNADVGPNPLCDITCYRIAMELNCIPDPISCPEDFSICASESAFSLGGLSGLSPSSSNSQSQFSGTGVIPILPFMGFYLFSPSDAGPGVHTITYSYINGSGCVSSCQFDIEVLPVEEVSCPGAQFYCVNEEPIDLNTLVSPSGGVFSGDNIVDGIYDPAAAGTGLDLITYTVTHENGCENSCSFLITVTPVPNSGFRNPGTIIISPFFGSVDYNDDHDICETFIAEYGASATPGVNSYAWSISGGGTILAGATSRYVRVQWNTPGIYTLDLVVTQVGTGCQASNSIEVTVLELPEVLCPADTTISAVPGYDDFCVGYYYGTHPVLAPSCSVNTLSIGINAQTPYVVSEGGIFTISDLPEGDHVITYSVLDEEDNTATCSFTITVSDTTAPVAVCRVGQVLLPSVTDYTLLGEDVLDLLLSGDACSDISVVSISPATINCDDLKNTVFFDVVISDEAGNEASCTATIEVGEDLSLESPWDNDDVGNANGSAEYSGCTNGGEYYISSTGFGFPNNDVIHSLFQEICGDGSITVHVASITNQGSAGIQFRESLAQGSRKVAFQTQLTNILVRQVRTVTNGMVNSQSLIKPNHTWLRIVRTGNVFTGYSSPNGINWQFAFTVSLVLPPCLQVGMYAQSINNINVVEAVFDNVTIVGSVPPPPPTFDPAVISIAQASSGITLNAQPNPATQTTSINIAGLSDGTEGIFTVTNIVGKIVYSGKVVNGSFDLNIHNWTSGLYVMRLEQDGLNTVNRLLIAR